MSFSLEYNLQEVENKENENLNNEEKADLDTSLTINDKFDPKFKGDMDTILSMGYDIKMIRKVYIFLKPNDINEALDYLSQQDGIYHHDFMERHGQKNKCFICGAPPANHINYEPPQRKSNPIIESIRNSIGYSNDKLNSNIVNFNSNGEDNNALLNEPLIVSAKNGKKEDNEKIEENEKNDTNEEIKEIKEKKEIKISVPKKPVYCDLCLEEMVEEEIKQNNLPCNHLFCNDCYLNFLQDKIKNNKVGKITCMQFKCAHKFDENFIISHLQGDQLLINKYKKFKLRNDLYSDEDIKFCPIKDCESYAKKVGDNKYVTCLEGHQFCFQCSKPWHGNKKCQDEIDKDFKKWKKNKIIKRCPKCKFWTEKNLGCNHMTCPECKHEWCWFCGAKCDPGHFKMGGGCYGLQFTNKSCYNNCLFLYGYKFMIWLFQAIMLIFYIPLLMIVYGWNLLDNEFGDKYPKFLYYPTASFFIISFFPLFVGLGSIFFIVCVIVWCLKKKAITFLLDLAGY